MPIIYTERVFFVRIVNGTSTGPYTIYKNSVDSNNILKIFSTNNSAQNLTLSQLQVGVKVSTVTTTFTDLQRIIVYNQTCNTSQIFNIISPTPLPTYTSIPLITLNPSPTPTNTPTSTIPGATPGPTASPTFTATLSATPTLSATITLTPTPSPSQTCECSYYDFFVGIEDWGLAKDHKLYVSYTNCANVSTIKEFTDNGYYGNILCKKAGSPAPVVYYYDSGNNYTIAFDSYVTNTNNCCSNDLTPTPYPTITPEPTPSVYYAYVFAEPQNPEALNHLSNYMYEAGASNFFGYGNSNLPQTTDYEIEMIMYSKYPGFINGDSSRGFISRPIDLTSEIRQLGGTGLDTYSCTQNQYTFGSIRVSDYDVNSTDTYFYSIWIPLNGVGGTMNNMTVDVSGYGGSCGGNIYANDIPSPSLSAINVNVPTNASIPAGIYRVLWSPTSGYLPGALLNSGPLYIKGNSKT